MSLFERTKWRIDIFVDRYIICAMKGFFFHFERVLKYFTFIGEVKKCQFESSKNQRKISTVLHLFHLYQAFTVL